MTAVASFGAVPFCPECKALLSLPDRNPIRCVVCEYQMTYEDLGETVIVTSSAERPAPRWYQDLGNMKRGSKDEDATAKHAKVEEPCPKCGHPEMSFYTMQLRSADEGSTVFYECLNKKCGHKYSLNN